LKYFVLGSFSSGLLLFGFSLVYAATGSTSLEVVQEVLDVALRFDLISAGVLFFAAALLFKLGAVPFHVWLCDVYEGSPTAATFFFAIVPKLVLLYLLFKLLFSVFVVQNIF
jgi:NADH-quinone oxidoreductase subunit N